MERIQASRDNSTCNTVDNNGSEPETEVIFNFKGSDRQTQDNQQSENYLYQASNHTQTTEQVAAAASLMQLHEAPYSQTDSVPPNPCMSRNIPQTTPISSYDHSIQSMQSIGGQSLNMLNSSSVPHSALYSDVNIRNTVAGLSNALTIMKQQQVSMEVKQDTISGTLMNVLSLLQEVTKKSQNFSRDTCGSSTENGGAEPSSGYNVPEQSMQPTMDRTAGGQVIDEGQCERNRSDIYRGTHAIIENGENYSSNAWQTQDTRWADNHRQTDRTNSDYRGNLNGSNMTYGHENENSSRHVQYRMHEDPRMQNRAIQARDGRYQTSIGFNEIKLPPFNGKEEWKVWVSRFEAIANRRQWSEETKLDNLLPKLQGKAGEFVFTQLPRHTLSHYEDLIKELNSRFRVVETKKTFAAKFSQRTQKPGETAEEFAAELKRLYAKAHSFRDEKTRQEDLVRRFLDGLRDSDARFEIEYNKEPEDIDEAVYHAVNFVQTKHRGSTESSADRKCKRYARRSKLECDSSADEESQDEGEDLKRVCRLPAKKEKAQDKKELNENELKNDLGNAKQTAETESLKVLTEAKDMMQKLMKQMQDIVKSNGPVTTMQQEQKPFRGRNVVCYGCSQIGHVIRECPQRNNRPIGKKPQGPVGSNRIRDPGVGGSKENQNLN